MGDHRVTNQVLKLQFGRSRGKTSDWTTYANQSLDELLAAGVNVYEYVGDVLIGAGSTIGCS